MPTPNPFRRDPAAEARKALDTATRALAKAEANRDKAEAEVAAAERAQDVAATADGEAQPGVLAAATRAVRDARDLRADLDDRILPAARAAVTAAEAAVADAERVALCDAALAKRKVAATRLSKEYGPAINTLIELKAMLAEANQAIDKTNANLPAGRDPIDTVEALARDIPYQPRTIISEKVQDVWYFADGERVPRPDWVRQTPSKGDRTGLYFIPKAPNVHQLEGIRCVMVRKRVVTSIPAQPGITGSRLADMTLPPLKPDAPTAPEPVTEYLPVQTDTDRDAA